LVLFEVEFPLLVPLTLFKSIIGVVDEPPLLLLFGGGGGGVRSGSGVVK
jgi:hypothetical protein